MKQGKTTRQMKKTLTSFIRFLTKEKIDIGCIIYNQFSSFLPKKLSEAAAVEKAIFFFWSDCFGLTSGGGWGLQVMIKNIPSLEEIESF